MSPKKRRLLSLRPSPMFRPRGGTGLSPPKPDPVPASETCCERYARETGAHPDDCPSEHPPLFTVLP